MKIAESVSYVIYEMLDNYGELTYKEHRKGSSFYATREIEEVEKEMVNGRDDLSFLVGKCIVQQGTWSDEWGFEADDLFEIYDITKTIVPEHTRTIVIPEKISRSYSKLELELE